jgi:hypothetical protein
VNPACYFLAGLFTLDRFNERVKKNQPASGAKAHDTTESRVKSLLCKARGFSEGFCRILSGLRQIPVGKPDQIANLAQFANAPVESLIEGRLRVDPRLFFRHQLAVDKGVDEFIGKFMSLTHSTLRIIVVTAAFQRMK